MKPFLVYTILILALMFSCVEALKKSDIPKDNSETLGIKNTNSRFDIYLNRIELLSLPCSFECFDFINFESQKVNSEIIDTTFACQWEIPYRRIDTNLKFRIIIYLSPADIYTPILKTFDFNGKELSTLQLFQNCGQEPGFRSLEFVTINPNLQIVKIDSIWRWEIDDNYKEIESTKKLEIAKTFFEIENNGLIIKK